MFMRDIENVCEVPLGLHAMRKRENKLYNKLYLVQLVCFPCAFEVVPESLRKGLHQGLNGIKTIFAGKLIFIWM